MRRLPFAIGAFVLGISASAVTADDGFWTEGVAFTQLDAVACMREYTCGAPLGVYYNGGQTVLATSP